MDNQSIANVKVVNVFLKSAFKPHILHFSSIKRITAKLASIPRDMCQAQLKLAANFASLESAGVSSASQLINPCCEEE